MSELDHLDALAETGFWGRAGAGCLIRARATGRLLLALRSQGVTEPGTWGVWGGAIDAGERPEDAARRECLEETGATPDALEPLYLFAEPGGFRYHTFLGHVPEEFAPVLSWETDAHRWIAPGAWPTPLHFGLKALLNDTHAAARLHAGP